MVKPSETLEPVVSHEVARPPSGTAGAEGRHGAERVASLAGGALLLDRDGVINVQETGRYVNSWRDFRFVPGTLDAFRAIAEAGVPTYVVTNQGGVGRGYLAPNVLTEIHDRMMAAIMEAGGRLDAIVHCPHHPQAGCACRKPRPGMLATLRDRFGVDLGASTFVGDNVTDLEAGRDAGCATVLVGTGEGQRSASRLGIAVPAGGFAPVSTDAMPGLVGAAASLYDAVVGLLSRATPSPG